jgi:hypothetical protein
MTVNYENKENKEDEDEDNYFHKPHKVFYERGVDGQKYFKNKEELVEVLENKFQKIQQKLNSPSGNKEDMINLVQMVHEIIYVIRKY